MRAVLDTNVLVSALLAPGGAPADLLRDWVAGRFELVVSEATLSELERVLARPQIEARVDREERAAFLDLLRAEASLAGDPSEVPALRSRDPADDFLLALVAAERVALVTGDADLLELADRAPIFSPREFLTYLDEHVP